MYNVLIKKNSDVSLLIYDSILSYSLIVHLKTTLFLKNEIRCTLALALFSGMCLPNLPFFKLHSAFKRGRFLWIEGGVHNSIVLIAVMGV